MLFEQKKINLETLGEYLKAVRENCRFSMADVSAKTGIKAKFLQHLEEGKFQALPPQVYVLGFLKQLGALYHIQPDILIDQYKKELAIQKQLRAQPAQAAQRRMPKFIVTPKNLSYFFGGAFVIFTVIYIIWQVFSINRTPSLNLFQPQDHQVVTESFVNVVGQTDAGMSVSINGEPVFVDKDGNFKKQLGLAAGPKTLEVVAKNKFGKSISRELEIMGQSTVASQPGVLQLKLDFFADTQITVNIDGGGEQQISFHNGDSKIFLGQQKILLSTSDAGATRATLNGQVLGALGRPREQLNNIPFFADGFNATTSPGQKP